MHRMKEGEYQHKLTPNEGASLVKHRLTSMGGRMTHSRLLNSLSGSLHAAELEEIEQLLVDRGEVRWVGKVLELIVA